jgi:uncharacterized protein YkwD
MLVVALVAAALPALPTNANARHRRQRLRRQRSPCTYADTPAGMASRAAIKRAVVCLINRQRIERGLPRLRESRRLDRAAQGWTNAMVATGSFSHGFDPAARISSVGFAWRAAGENIATGFLTPRAVVDAWMASVDHCHNILSPLYSNVGTGVVRRVIRSGNWGATWTQDFALPARRRPPSEDWVAADSCPY